LEPGGQHFGVTCGVKSTLKWRAQTGYKRVADVRFIVYKAVMATNRKVAGSIPDGVIGIFH
jgi:hypothetical protein